MSPEGLPPGEIVDLLSRETEESDIVESYDDTGNFSMTRIANTPDANRPGVLGLPHRSTWDITGSHFYDYAGNLLFEYGASPLDSQNLESFQQTYLDTDGFIDVDLTPVTQADLDSIAIFASTAMLADGSLQVVLAGSTDTITSKGARRITSFLDADLGHRVTHTSIYELTGESSGRPGIEIETLHKQTSTGICYDETYVTVRHYKSGDKSRSKPDAALSTYDVEAFSNGSSPQSVRIVPADHIGVTTDQLKATVDEVIIVNSIGQVVERRTEFPLYENIDISHLPSGMYVIRAGGGQNFTTTTIIR